MLSMIAQFPNICQINPKSFLPAGRDRAHMNIKQIESFVRIVELGSFQAAARDLNASPSTISARVRELEGFLGAELFDRSFHRAHLTPKGQEFYGRARHLFEYTRALVRESRESPAVTGVMRVGVAGLAAMTWFPATLQTLHDMYPRVGFKLEVGLTHALLTQLAGGKLDLAIVAGPVAHPALQVELIGSDEFAWMRGADATASSQEPLERPLTPADIRALGVMSFAEDSFHYPKLQDWFSCAGVSFEPLVTCNQMAVLAELTARSVGVSLLPMKGFAQWLQAGRLQVLCVEPAFPSVDFSLVYRRGRKPVIADALLSIARERAASSHPPP